MWFKVVGGFIHRRVHGLNCDWGSIMRRGFVREVIEQAKGYKFMFIENVR